MRGVIIPNYHHSYTFFFFFVFLVLFPHVYSINTLSSTETLTISSNRTIVSPGDVYELGFFKTTKSSRDRWYLGIWYKSTSERTYVWIANRDKPFSNSIGTLKISNANLVLLDQHNTPVWSTKLKKAVKSSLVSELLANGNFVLRDSKTNDPNRFLWQSFDFPVDTLLPEMKLGRSLKTRRVNFLTSWKSSNDPSSGDFSFKLGTQGLSEFYLFIKDSPMYRTGPWNGMWFSGIPSMQNWSYVVNSFIENKEEVAYTFKLTNQRIHSSFTLSSSGLLQLFTWTSSTLQVPNLVWFSPQDDCDLYSRCGPYSYCDIKTSPMCNCIKGFVPRNFTAWVSGDEFYGCVRESPLSCGRGDAFLAVKNMKLPDTSTAIVDKRIGLKECKERCIRDCKCTAFANADIRIGGFGCVIWTEELRDMRSYVVGGGQDLYVKLASNSLVH